MIQNRVPTHTKAEFLAPEASAELLAPEALQALLP